MIDISGSTRIFPVVAWPIEQVKAPVLFNAYFQQHNIDARVIPLEVPRQKYILAVRMLMDIPNIGGMLVSIPHKLDTLQAVDQATPRAVQAGAANVVYRKEDGSIVGDLIDGEGFVRALERVCHGDPFDWKRSRALIVGCGGVGSAIAASLAQKGIAEIGLYDISMLLANSLQTRLRTAFLATQVFFDKPLARGYDLVVNSTPLGMNPEDPIPISLEGVDPHCIVADCGMKTEMSPLLLNAQQRGCRIQKGKEMLIEQAPLYLDLFGWPGVTSDNFRALGVL